MEKVTNKEMFTKVIALATEKNDTAMVDWAQAKIDALNAKAEKARAKAAEKKADGDALRDAVLNVLGDEAMTVADIVAALNDPDVSANKVVYRANALVDLGMAAKENVKVPGVDGAKARTLVGFKRV